MASDTPAETAETAEAEGPDETAARTARILTEITGMLVEVVGDEFLLADEVTLGTTFNADLALESIEFVALAELLHQRYGSGVDLIGFLAERDMEEILAMTVGDLVSHIAGAHSPATAV
ncbi:acyl carrier protein [Streptomyces gobiensis]|uniref:acyl carrier protein n=1 Tax=Streptomyces gobiensis TaxID=2875706 RepID=UPI001E4A6802|nr:acyl carrier protein [Streptomyces gobiensis]UGY94916.1 acyl carrier protein [Streptomyces gobiensis]